MPIVGTVSVTDVTPALWNATPVLALGYSAVYILNTPLPRQYAIDGATSAATVLTIEESDDGVSGWEERGAFTAAVGQRFAAYVRPTKTYLRVKTDNAATLTAGVTQYSDLEIP